MIDRQETEYEYEVICVDSGSTDNTVDIIKAHHCVLKQIDKSEFGHGKTRNLGASLGTGEYIIFITQDALPYDTHWIQNFIDGMKSNPEIVGGFANIIRIQIVIYLIKEILHYYFKGMVQQIQSIN